MRMTVTSHFVGGPTCNKCWNALHVLCLCSLGGMVSSPSQTPSPLPSPPRPSLSFAYFCSCAQSVAMSHHVAMHNGYLSKFVLTYSLHLQGHHMTAKCSTLYYVRTCLPLLLLSKQLLMPPDSVGSCCCCRRKLLASVTTLTAQSTYDSFCGLSHICYRLLH